MRCIYSPAPLPLLEPLLLWLQPSEKLPPKPPRVVTPERVV
jgi:hypothetical protein